MCVCVERERDILIFRATTSESQSEIHLKPVQINHSGILNNVQVAQREAGKKGRETKKTEKQTESNK